jgi:predicted transcriptional regulator
MPTERIDDLRAFRDFVDGQLGNGGADLTPEECLDHWILENSSDSERRVRLAEIQQGLDDLDAGRTRPAREALNELRRKHSLPEAS